MQNAIIRGVTGFVAVALLVFVAPALKAAPSDAAMQNQPSIAAAFFSMCTSGDVSVRSVLKSADDNGWRRTGANLPADFDPATEREKDSDGEDLTLHVGSSNSAGETRNVCSVSSPAKTPDIVASVQTAFGFPPAVNLGTAATFFAVKSGSSWVSAARISRPEFALAKSQGRFFSITAGTTSDGSNILLLQVVPDGKP